MKLALELNDFHKEHKEALTIKQISALADAGFTDVSWASNECASFASPCQDYELFVNLATDNAADEFQVCIYDVDGFADFLGGSRNLSDAIKIVETHKKQKGS